jgi:hypothetical protein
MKKKSPRPMKAKVSIAEDPVVSEVRAARRALWQAGGGTFEGLARIVKTRTMKPSKPSRSKTKRAA